MKLSKTARQAQILSELNQTPSLRVADLAERLAVSTETIRRDLDDLTRHGHLNRTYGGAVRPLSTEPALNERHRILVPEREKIGKAAAKLIRSGSLLMIGSGATTVHVARRIAVEHKNLTVITHSFGVATVLSINPTITVLICPGNYNSREGATYGAHTVAFLNSFSADYAILGASGLTPEGPSDALIESAAVYSAMSSRASETLIAADHSKFDKHFPARYANWKQVRHMVTDVEPEGALAAALVRNGVSITI